SGPHRGKVFTLTESECSIGREPDNRIHLCDLSVSRHHCRIYHEADQFILRDLESLNCTFINGVPIRERRLAHGDWLKIGDSIFIFVLYENESPQASFPVKSESSHITSPTILLRTALEDTERLEWLEQENRRLLEEINLDHSMVGESPRMRELYQFIAKVAFAGSTVLIRGESGTGKE